MNYLQAGQTAPNFCLKNQDGVDVELSALLANHQVLLYFYPKAMTPGCTVQACGLRDSQEALKAQNVIAVGVSTDPVKSLKKFVERDGLNFILLSDPDHQLADAFGVWGPKKFMGRVYDGIHRVTFLIGQDGVVKQVFEDFKTSNHHDVVLRALAG